MKLHTGIKLGLVAVVLLFASAAQATLLVTGVGPDGREATADFSWAANELTVILTNTSTADTGANGWLLSGVFFDYDALGGTGAIEDATEVLLYDNSIFTADGSVDGSTVDLTSGFSDSLAGEFGYMDAVFTNTDSSEGPLGVQFGGAQYGVNSSGLGPFGVTSRISTADADRLDDPDSPDGPNIGIIGPGTRTILDSGDQRPWISNADGVGGSIIITFATSGDFSLDGLGNFGFQYGTSFDEPFVPGDPVPEPATMTLMGLGLAGAAIARRRKQS